MNTMQMLLLVLFLSGWVDAIYKRWIPNTNFENASNWAEQRLPCSQDKAVFASKKKVSVFVQSAHSLKSLYLPLDGEFILSPGAGFMAAPAEDPTCGEGSLVNFGDVDHYQWFDPTLWQSVSIDALENGNMLFNVDSERVPCQHDDVMFSSDTSFRVQVQETESEIQLKSISVLGRKFSSGAEFGEYLASHTGRLQFPGPAQPQVTNINCMDKTGCLCGNDRVQQEICSALLQNLGNKCPEVSCTKPLKPIGHCCGICGQSFGITKAEIDFSIGASTSTQKGSLSALGITGIILGIVLLVSLLGLAYYLHRMDAFRLADTRFFWFRRNISRLEEDVSVEDGGFSNPVFEPTAENEANPRLQTKFKEGSSESAFQFSNPLYDGNIEA
ncbi:protein amnionless isoform X2 [Lithobates pipiens]